MPVHLESRNPNGQYILPSSPGRCAVGDPDVDCDMSSDITVGGPDDQDTTSGSTRGLGTDADSTAPSTHSDRGVGVWRWLCSECAEGGSEVASTARSEGSAGSLGGTEPVWRFERCSCCRRQARVQRRPGLPPRQRKLEWAGTAPEPCS